MDRLAFSLPLPAAFTKLNLESIGSPAPWTTTTSSLSSSCAEDDDGSPVPTLSLRHRVLLSALASLSAALSSASEQSAVLSHALARAEAQYECHRLAAIKAKEAVLTTSKAAQKAHSEAKRVERLNGVFREGADRSVKALERKVVRMLRRRARGKEPEHDERELVPLEFVEELIVDLDFEEKDVLEASRREAEEGIELDEEWRAIEADLVRTMAAKVTEKRRPRRRSSACEADREKPQEGENDETVDVDESHLPPTPPASIHSSNSSDVEVTDDDSPASSTPSSPDLHALSSSLDASLELLPLVHPVLLLLFHLHRTISHHLSHSVDTFESLVRASSSAVDAHRVANAKATKSGGRLLDLRDLDRRETEEWERVMDELRTTTVELAKLVLQRPVEAEVATDPEEDE